MLGTYPELLYLSGYGQGWIRTSEGISQQIYSLPRLAASVPTRNEGFRGSPFAILGLRFSTALNS
jgi:hypothetical protein